MKVYGEFIFPRLMDWVMSGKAFQRLRGTLLEAAHGEVLEIGYGTGLNLCHYTEQVSHLAMIDPARLLPSKVRERVMQAPFPVHIERVAAELLPFREQRFDVVVSTWTLCSIPDPLRALHEVRRVLKPHGLFLFLEHGRSEKETTAAWQDRLNPVQNLLGCGCNLNRPIDHLIEQSGLRITHLDRFQMPHVPRIAGEMYQGHATPQATCET
jgi:ubiquinone/menaquinone biosynthesis C-methylase UbiE